MCMVHHHVLPSGDALLAAAERALVTAGEQWTAMRADVFNVLADADRPLSAYDIAERSSARRKRRVAANSVYRILDLFVAKNIVLRIESASAYAANPHPGCVHDCMFLVCTACGRIEHVDDDPVAHGVRRTADGEGFKVDRTVIEAHGVCEDCRAQHAVDRDALPS